MAKVSKTTPIFRVRAVDSCHIFYGDEHPDLGGKPMELAVGAPPKEVPASLAEYFSFFPGLRVDTPTIPATDPSEE